MFIGLFVLLGLMIHSYLSANDTEVQAFANNQNMLKSELQNLYTGDLTRTFELMHIPGSSSLDYTVNLNYASGIKTRQKASWVGLGFDLSAPMITRSVVKIPDDEDQPYSLEGNPVYGEGRLLGGSITTDWNFPDYYFLKMNGVSDQLIVNSQSSVHLRRWKNWEITFENPVNGIDSWTLTTDQGITYMFTKKLRQVSRSERYLWSSGVGGRVTAQQLEDIQYQEYTYAWLCTSITGPDYSDANGNGIPDDGDSGGWFVFTYKFDNSHPVKRLTYTSSHVIVDATTITPNTEEASWHYTTTQIDHTYLSSITSPTHKIVFTNFNRYDERDDNNNSVKGLGQIELIRRTDNASIKTIEFGYNYDLCNGAPRSTLGHGKLTLTDVDESYYTSDYNNESPPLHFSYNYNPDYNGWNMDLWGYYRNIQSDVADYIMNLGHGDLTDWDGYFHDFEIHEWGEVNFPPPYYELPIEATNEATAWSLTDITYPSGATVHYSYGVDQYRYYQKAVLEGDIYTFHMTQEYGGGGGIRVESINTSNGMGETTTTIYTYTDGIATYKPLQSVQAFRDQTGISPYYQNEVHYAQVTTTQGTGAEQKITETSFYTAMDYPDEDPNYYGAPGTSMAWKRGQIKSRTMEDRYHNILSSEEFTYTLHQKASLENVRGFRGDHSTGDHFTLYSGWAALSEKDKYVRGSNGNATAQLITTYDYNNSTGTVRTITATSNGKTKVTHKKYTYEQYPTAVNLRDYRSVYATTISNGTGAVKAKRWTMWGAINGAFRPTEEWQWIGNGNPNDGTAPADPGPSEPETQRTKSYDQYNVLGNVLQVTDANGVPTSMKYGLNPTTPIAKAENALSGETDIFTAENGLRDWEPNKGTITAIRHHSGDSSIYCDNQYGPTKNFYQINGVNANTEYIAEGWVYRENGAARISLSIRDANDTQILNRSNSLSSGSGWQHLELRLSLAEMTNLPTGGYIRLYCGFPNTGNHGYVDDVRFYPADALPTQYTYNLRNQVTSAINPASTMSQTKYSAVFTPFRTLDNDGAIRSVIFESANLTDFDEILPKLKHRIVFPAGNLLRGSTILPTYFRDYENYKWWSKKNDANWDIVTYLGLTQDNNGGSLFMAMPGSGAWSGDYTPDDVVQVDGGEPYQFVLMARGENLTLSPLTARLVYETAQLARDSLEITLSISGGTHDWQQVVTNFTMPETAQQLKAMRILASGTAGKLWLDGLQCYQADRVVQPIVTTIYTDGLGLVHQTHTRVGNEDLVTRTDYDQLERVVQQWNPYQRDVNRQYDDQLPPSGTGVQAHQYDALDRPVQVIPPGGTAATSIRTTYAVEQDVDGQYYPTQLITDENGHQTKTIQDMFDNKIAQYDGWGSADEVQTRFTYDILDHLTAVENPEGQNTTFTYTPAGHLVETTTPDQGTTKYWYDPQGNLIFQQDANRAGDDTYGWTYKTYDAHNRILESGLAAISPTTDPAGVSSFSIIRKQQFYYDQNVSAHSRGLLAVAENTESHQATQWDYDQWGHSVGQLATFQSRVQTAGGEVNNITGETYSLTVNYSRSGQLHTLEYPSGLTVAQRYNNRGMLASIPGYLDGGSSGQGIAYTPAGKIAHLYYNSGVTQNFEYTTRQWMSFNTLVNYDFFDEYNIVYNYDNTGNLVSERRVSGLVPEADYHYDALNRLDSIHYNTQYAPVQNIAYTYDANGNRITRTIDGQTDTYHYPSGLPYNQLQGVNNNTDYDYDAVGNLSVDRAKAQLYRYDWKERLADVWQLTYSDTHPAAEPGTFDLDNGFFHYQGANNTGGKYALKTIPTLPVPAEHMEAVNVSFDFQRVSHIDMDRFYFILEDTLTGNFVRLQYYSRQQDLKFEQRGAGSVTSIYEDLNYSLPLDTWKKIRFQFVGDIEPLIFVYINGIQQAVAMLQPGITHFNRIRLICTEADYGLDNIAITTTYPGYGDYQESFQGTMQPGSFGTYQYNTRDQRVQKATGEGTDRYVYFNNQVLAEYRDNALRYNYLYANGQRIARVNNSGAPQYFHNDYLGSARRLTDTSWNLLWSRDYYPFGGLRYASGSGNPYQFTGKERDKETELDYSWHRYYNPTLGRFTQVDEKWEKYPSLTPYQYTANNPLKFIDPNGEEILDINGKHLTEAQKISLSLQMGYNIQETGSFTPLLTSDLKPDPDFGLGNSNGMSVDTYKKEFDKVTVRINTRIGNLYKNNKTLMGNKIADSAFGIYSTTTFNGIDLFSSKKGIKTKAIFVIYGEGMPRTGFDRSGKKLIRSPVSFLSIQGPSPKEIKQFIKEYGWDIQQTSENDWKINPIK